jgi:hypothetical protein
MRRANVASECEKEMQRGHLKERKKRGEKMWYLKVRKK